MTATPQNLGARLNQMASADSASLTDEDKTRWAMTFGSMPFGAGLQTTREPQTFADVTLILGRLAARLGDHGDTHNALAAEHANLRRDVNAMRRVLGTGGSV
jgi:hypothetical protein